MGDKEDLKDRQKVQVITIMGGIIAILILIIAMIFIRGNSKVDLTDVDKINKEIEKSLGIESDPYKKLAELDSKETKSSVTEIKESVNNMQNKNTYLSIVTSEDTAQIAIMNKKGQGIVQDNYDGAITVFLGDGKSYLYTDEASKVPNATVLEIIDNVADLVEQGKYKMYRDVGLPDDYDEEEKKILNIRYVDFEGYDEIYDVYAKFGDELARNIVDNVKMSTVDNEKVTYRYIFVYGENEEFSVGNSFIVDGEEFISWWFDGHLELYDWELPKEWHELETESETFQDDAEQLLKVLVIQLDEMMNQYAEDNNLLEENPVTEETEEGHFHEDGTFHSNDDLQDDDNPITEETEEGHYHEDGTFHPKQP